MITLNIFCDLFWLWWLLPLLLGALLTWLYWKNKYNTMMSEYNGKIKGLNGRISGLEGDLVECGNKRSEVEGDLALTKGRMREMEADMKAQKGKTTKPSADKGQADTTSNKGETTGSNDPNVSSLTSSSTSSTGDTTGSGDVNLGNITSSLAGGMSGTSSSESGDSSGGSKGAGAIKKYNIADDNLQIIEGIGPKMESVLKENGVSSHASLASKSTSELQEILDKYGDKYKIIDPATWAQQAKHAADGDYDVLIDLQKRLDAGKNGSGKLTDSKLEKYLIKKGFIKAFKQDDLKAIEGIGPATEKLLHSNGIMTWRDLANTEATAIKAMLTAAGSRFALGDPTTWPKQAEMAADGEFDKLREYQDYLDGGKG